MRYFSRSSSNASDHSTNSRSLGPMDTVSRHAQQRSSDADPDDESEVTGHSAIDRRLSGHSRATSAQTLQTSGVTSQPSSPRLNHDFIPARTSSKEASNDSTALSRSDSLARQLLSRGRRLKSSSSKLSISSMASSINSESTARSPTDAHSRNKSRGSRSPSRSRSISNPSEFQHMAHMEPAQFIRMNDMSENDLVADFSALRASQHQRRDFRGIKAVDLHSRNSSTETATASATPSDRSSAQFSTTTSGTSSTRSSVQNIDNNVVPKGHIRKNLSQESFSQPFSNGRPPRSAPNIPVSAPPRTSSKRATMQHEAAQSAPLPSQVLADREPGLPHSASKKSIGQQPEPEADAGAESSSEDECKTNEPSNPTVASGAWPLPVYGQALSVVDEEEQTPGKLVSSRIAPRSSRGVPSSVHPRQSCRADPVSSSSSSEESNATITPASYAQNLNKSKTGSLETPPSSIARYQADEQRRVSMKRSSMNHGLFSSWVEADDDSSDDEDESAAEQHQASSTCKESSQSNTPSASGSRESSRRTENITALPRMDKKTDSSSTSKRSSRDSEQVSSKHRSSTGSKTASTSSSKQSSSKPSSSSKHSRYASEPPSSTSKDSKPSKKRSSAS